MTEPNRSEANQSGAKTGICPLRKSVSMPRQQQRDPDCDVDRFTFGNDQCSHNDGVDAQRQAPS